ncbi:hypothetical protein G6011_04833 [Alternaria panax]|uniref:Uncharacterized protein n=1 Tax=Alternaria panax TaxID=48097 RepID=A0AAD4NUI5_9PLEO|nr:hypothetical protein G6011_04833 [Alternaria panax]
MSYSPQNTYIPGRCNTPPADAPTRRTGLSMTDFLYSGPLDTPASALSNIDDGAAPLSTRLCESRLRFTKKIPIDLKSDICCPRDRRAALAVYDEAIDTIKSANGYHFEDHVDVETEAKAKIEIILGIERADPYDHVFQRNRLLPIDPMYAEPRIEASNDTLSYHASWRLHEWRQDGWPESFPGRAIEKEKTMKGDPKQTPEEELEAILSVASAEESIKATRNAPKNQRRADMILSGRALVTEDEQKTVFKEQELTPRNALKAREPKKTNKDTLLTRDAEKATLYKPTDNRTEGEDTDAVKELEHQGPLVFLAGVERQEGYIRSDLAEPDSAVRSSFEHVVSDDDFTAALITREMANQGSASAPSKASNQQLMNLLASGSTEKPKSRINKGNSLTASKLRRLGRNKTGMSSDRKISSPPTTQIKPSISQPLNLDENEGFIPSMANCFRFRYDSPSGLRAEELGALLKPPSRPKGFPADFTNEKISIAKSYKCRGQKSKANVADQMIEQMELEMNQRQQDVETMMAEDDRQNEL